MSIYNAGMLIYGAYSAYSASKSSGDQDDATAAANESNAAALAFNMQRYDTSRSVMDITGAAGSALWQAGLGPLEDAKALADMQSNAYQMESADYKARADRSLQTMENYYEGFLGNFQEMLGTNSMALMAFNSTYGPIMDNVREGIMATSSTQLAASGREQLSLDMETLGKTFDTSMAQRGMARSGLDIEADKRLASDTAQQARAIDVNSINQATQLQSQGIQNLNSMYGIGQGLQDQRMNILGQRGEGMQQIGNTYGNLASNFYNASTSLFGQGFNNQLNARTNIGNAYQSLGSQRLSQYDGFYSGIGASGASGVSNAYTNQSSLYSGQAAQAGRDASGYASAAGSALGNVDWSNFNYNSTSTAPGE